MILASDYDTYAVTYLCEQVTRNFKQEYVYIDTRDPLAPERVLNKAVDALREKYPDFDLNRLVKVTQGVDVCEYSDL